MKRVPCIFLVVILAMSLIACGVPAVQETVSLKPDITQAPDVVEFTDMVLEAMVREAMGKPEGDNITLKEAEAVTELNLGIEWQQDSVEETQIKDISGLENFKNLENLDLSFHAVSDIAPLAEMNKLTKLSLGGNPVADITPLSGLTNLTWLTLFNCAAEDYSALANLTNLDGLLMEYSTVGDVSMLSGLTKLQWLSLANTQVNDVAPLATLVSLKKLQLAECPITDYSPLKGIFPNLEEKDFMLFSSLEALGFKQVDDFLGYKTEDVIVTIRHENLEKQDNYPVVVIPSRDDEKHFEIGYYPDDKKYVVIIHNEYGENVIARYKYDMQSKNASFENGKQQEIENIINEMLPDAMGNIDLLEAPIKLFGDTLAELFCISADELYTLPFETKKIDKSSLAGLGFIAIEENAKYFYEQKGKKYYNVEIHNPEWGGWEEGGDVRFFTPLSDKYGILVTYYSDEKKFLAGVNYKDGGGAKFEFFIETHEHIDVWCSEDIPVEEYFKNAYNDPEIEDIYLHSVELMQKYISDTFGMSIDRLYALPFGE